MIVTYMLAALTLLWGSAYACAQVSVHQSQSSSVNGHTQQQSIQTTNGHTQVSTTHGFLNIDGNKIMYCQDLKHNGNLETCGPTYTLNSDGSIGK